MTYTKIIFGTAILFMMVGTLVGLRAAPPEEVPANETSVVKRLNALELVVDDLTKQNTVQQQAIDSLIATRTRIACRAGDRGIEGACGGQR